MDNKKQKQKGLEGKVKVNSSFLGLHKWDPRPNPDPENEHKSRKLASELNVSNTLAKLLLQRNFEKTEEVKCFLYPQLASLPQPKLMQDMTRAISLIVDSLDMDIPIIIHGDYDVDGICSTALLVDFLQQIKKNIHWHIPNRISDGYGLSPESIHKIAKNIPAPALLITVDCGINSSPAIQAAKKIGYKTLITDHHVPPDTLPQADVILNPKRKDCSFPCKDLAGVGVTFFLVMGIRQHLTQNNFWTKKNAPNLKKYLDLVALGTVADIMPLTDTNRILVRAGLEVLKERSRPGTKALCEIAKLKEGGITAEDISFKMAPRINAAGRVGNPKVAVNLLLDKDDNSAFENVELLEKYNTNRKSLEAEATSEAIEQCELQVKGGKKAVVAIGNWHLGVIGIVASRLTEHLKVPAIVLTGNSAQITDTLRGSGRSIDNLNLHNILKSCKNNLIQFGGHPMAAGLTIHRDSLEAFREQFDFATKELSNGKQNRNIAFYDVRINQMSFISKSFLEEYQHMEPFGVNNPEPIFYIKDVKFEKTKIIHNHLKFSIKQDNKFLSGIGFGMSNMIKLSGNQVSIAFKIKLQTFRGVERLQLHLVDIISTS